MVPTGSSSQSNGPKRSAAGNVACRDCAWRAREAGDGVTGLVRLGFRSGSSLISQSFRSVSPQDTRSASALTVSKYARLWPDGFVANSAIIDPVDRYIHASKVVLGIDEPTPAANQPSLLIFGKSDLADTRQVRIRCFYIDSNKIHENCAVSCIR